MKHITTLFLTLLFAAHSSLWAASLEDHTVAPVVWHSPFETTFPTVSGQAWPAELAGTYVRLPERAHGNVSGGVWHNSRMSAGLSVSFYSNSPDITVRYGVKRGFSLAHMPATGVSGVDLYATDADGRIRWCSPQYSFRDTVTYHYNVTYEKCRREHGYDFTLCLPLFNEVKWMEIGVDSTAAFAFRPVSQESPVVIYGTSIAHGACASRPGMSWANIVARELGHPVVNLGFSGSGLLEASVFELMAEIKARMYIVDCMPNMMEEPLLSAVCQRTIDGVHTLRSHSSAPILLVEHSGYTGDGTSALWRKKWTDANRELRRAYDALTADGVTGLYYLTHDAIGFTLDDMVEGIHPSDLGMRRQADAVERAISAILYETPSTSPEGGETLPPHPSTSPEGGESKSDLRLSTSGELEGVTQQRDPYDWRARHEAVLKQNAAAPPDIVLIGNSITHYWAGLPTGRLVRGADSWEDLWRGHVVSNLGFGWDRIENALWRIHHGELDGYEAAHVFLLMGTNNLDVNTDAEIAQGIAELVHAVRLRQPKAQIHVCGILPRGDRFDRWPRANAAIQASLAAMKDTAGVDYLDLSPAVLNADGTFRPELFLDGLHPNAEGYRLLAKRIKKIVKL